MTKTKDNRIRNWSFILYPESAVENWRDKLDELHIEWVESPLHDKDLNADNQPKKPHWHILLMFDGMKSYEQILEICESIGATIPQRVHSTKGLVRYMAHLDNPDKVQYDIAKIIGHGGADVAQLLKPTTSARYTLIKEMSDFVRVHDISYFDELLYYAMDERFDDWFPLLCDNSAFIMSAVIKAAHQRNKDLMDLEAKELEKEREKNAENRN